MKSASSNKEVGLQCPFHRPVVSGDLIHLIATERRAVKQLCQLTLGRKTDLRRSRTENSCLSAVVHSPKISDQEKTIKVESAELGLRSLLPTRCISTLILY